MQSDNRPPPELRAPDQNRVLGGLADFTRILEKELGPLDLFLPVSSEFLEKASYGDPFFRMAPSGTGSRIPMTADRDYLMEGAFLGALAPMARPARRAAKSARGRSPMSEQEALSRFLDAYEQQQVQKFSKGGRVKDFLAKVLAGESTAKPTKDKPDPRRRRAIGLPKDITPKPGEMVVKEEVKKAPKTGETSVSLTEAMNIPMTRRDVLRAGAGQAISAMAPRGALGALAKAAASPVGVAEQVVKAQTPKVFSPLTVPGLIAQGLRKRMSNEAIAKMVKDQLGEDLEDWVIPNMRRPENAWDFDEIQEAAQGPLHYFTGLIDKYYEPGSSIRQAMREIRAVNPKLYERLKETARDTDMSVAEMMPEWSFGARLESAQDMARKGGYPFNVNKFLERHGYVVDIEDADEITDVLKDFGYSPKDFE